MPTINATADNVKSLVRLDIDTSDIAAPYGYVTRVDAVTGQSTVVRGHGSSTTINGLPYVPLAAGFRGVLYDTEAPLDRTCYYRLSAPSVTLNATSTFGNGYTDPWYPSSTAVTIRSFTAYNGTTSMTMQTGGATATPTVNAENIPTIDNAEFTLTVSMACNVSTVVDIGLNFRDSTGAILYTNYTAVTVLNSATFTFSDFGDPGAVSVQPFIRMEGTPAATTILTVYSAAVTNFAGTANSRPARVQSLGACQLKDPLRPGNNVRVDLAFDADPACTPTEGVFFQSMDTEQQGANAATFNVNNQAEPTVVSKTRSSISSTLTLVTRQFADRDRLKTLLAPGSPLLFQVPSEYGVADQYLSVGATSVSRVLPDHRFPIRVFSLPYAAVAAPGGPMQGVVGTRWGDICSTWLAVQQAGLTWQQLLVGTGAS